MFNSKTIGKFVAAAGIAGLAFMGTAQAVSVTYDGFLAPQGANWTHTQSLQKFDSVLFKGVLQKVTFTLTGAVSGSTQAYNPTDAAILAADSGIIGVRGTMSASLPDGTWNPTNANATVTGSGSTLKVSILPTHGWSIGDIAIGETKTFNTGTSSLTGSVWSDSVGTLNSFTGTGVVDFVMKAVGSKYFDGNLDLEQMITSVTAGSTYSITYDYILNPVPEPTAAMLLIVGSCSVLLRRRRRS